MGVFSEKVLVWLQCPKGVSNFEKSFRSNEIESKLCSRIISLVKSPNWPLLDFKLTYSTFCSENTYKMIYSLNETEYTVEFEFILKESDYWGMDKIEFCNGKVLTDFFDAEFELQSNISEKLAEEQSEKL